MAEPKEKKTTTKKVAVKKTVTKKNQVKKPVVHKVEVDDLGAIKKANEYLYAVGRRKTAIAQVRIYKKGKGNITINKKNLNLYFPTEILQKVLKAPLDIIGQEEKLDVSVRVVGGGSIGQAEAVRHGLSRALIQLNPNFRKPLKKAGFLTRDARKKERKKPGLKRARRAPQWKKR